MQSCDIETLAEIDRDKEVGKVQRIVPL